MGATGGYGKEIGNLGQIPKYLEISFFFSVAGAGTQAAPVDCSSRRTPIHTFFSSFPLAGPFPIQCNSRPVMTRRGLKRLDKTLKTISKTYI